MKTIVASFLFLMVINCGPRQSEQVSAEESTLDSSKIIILSEVERRYHEYCSGCHGKNADNFVGRKWIYGNAKSSLTYSMRNGYTNEGMPSFGSVFTTQQIEELADFILNISESYVEDTPTSEDLKFESKYLSYRLIPITDGIKNPWGMEFLPDGSLLVSDRDGDLYRVLDGKKNIVTGFPEVKAVGQGGMMDIKLHPNYKDNGWIYFSYTKGGESGQTTAVFRARLKENALKDHQEIFEALPYLNTSRHFGSRLEFDDEGYIYISVGDRGKRDENPQTLSNHCGKIHRLNDDGSIPEDNPYINTDNAMPSIYSYGHRNPQGLIKHPTTGKIWEHEHGPKGGDEINIISAGLNYGWPVVSYGINYIGTKFTDLTHKEGMEQPIHHWTPSIAPCGMTIVKGNMYPEWKGDVLSGSLKFDYLQRTKIKDGIVIEEEELLKDLGRMRNVKMGIDGFIYVAIENPGIIYKLVPR